MSKTGPLFGLIATTANDLAFMHHASIQLWPRVNEFHGPN